MCRRWEDGCSSIVYCPARRGCGICGGTSEHRCQSCEQECRDSSGGFEADASVCGHCFSGYASDKKRGISPSMMISNKLRPSNPLT